MWQSKHEKEAYIETLRKVQLIICLLCDIYAGCPQIIDFAFYLLNIGHRYVLKITNFA